MPPPNRLGRNSWDSDIRFNEIFAQKRTVKKQPQLTHALTGHAIDC